jgi:hypothetical protein
MYHLKFTAGTGEGKGLAIKGPPDLIDVPEEFTIAVWVRPSILLTKSYFFNAFNRIFLRCQNSDQSV